MTVAEAEAYTRALARSHYENFPVVSFLLPAQLRQPFYNVYAFCRWSDDLGDELCSTEESLRALDWWRNELVRCEQGEARHPVMIALRQTMDQFPLPTEPFHDLISAFERDQTQQSYATIEELFDYCRQSANPVGRILLHLAGCYREETVKLSDDVCTGLQLINFWQDVARDWKIGRIYLPEADRLQFGVTEQTLEKCVSTAEFRSMLKYEVNRAEALLNSGFPLARLVSREIRIDIRLFALGGLAICRKIRQLDYRVLEQRPKLSKWDLPGLFLKAFWPSR
ncbi:MAG: squalene synthase HpnC [Planctomycetaceae bacterium]|nr:squalene synthase HpnC [Planctomycetaceae bacterium]